ncbi:MAG: hypothetical protein GEV11_00310 [Streptosporangiales bacterium]|nr:hypothetical protein [Streptosporangiales bacterium]
MSVKAGMLIVAVLNLEAGGFDRRHGDHRNLERLPELIEQEPDVDVLLFLEGKNYGLQGQSLRYRTENLLAPFGLRSFMTTSTIGQIHNLVFVRWPRLRPVTHHKPELPDVNHDQIGWLRFVVDGLDRDLALRAEHLPFWGGDARLDAAQKVTRFAAPGVLALLGGDLNALWPDCEDHSEFEPDWERLPPHKRHHKTLAPELGPDGRPVSDRRATRLLQQAGWVNAGCVAGDMTPTVNDRADRGHGARIDHILLSPDLAPALVPESYRVWVSDIGDQLSDHRMISAWLDLDQL